MWRLEERGGEKKALADLTLQKVEKIFCWMLFQLSAQSLSLPLSPYLCNTNTHTHISLAFKRAHGAAFVHLNALQISLRPQRPLKDCGENKIKGYGAKLAAPSMCYN